METTSDPNHPWHDLAHALRHLSSVPHGLQDLVDALADIPDTHIDHDTCRAYLPAYVAAELAELEVATYFPAIYQHLRHCNRCEADYIRLYTVGLEIESSAAPDCVPPDLSFLPPLSVEAFVRDVAHLIVAQAFPLLLNPLMTLAEMTVDENGTVSSETSPSNHEIYGFHVRDARAIWYSTYHSTLSVLRELTRLPAEPHMLQTYLHHHAYPVAITHNLQSHEAEQFALHYAEVVAAHRWVLIGLQLP